MDIKNLNAKSNDATQNTIAKAKRKFEPRLITVKKAEGEPGNSQAAPNDPFTTYTTNGMLIEPPFDMLTLAMIPENSSEMVSCIDAMRVNIDGFGHRFVSRVVKPEDASETIKSSVAKERIDLVNFFQYCTDESFTEFRQKLRSDLESTGNAYFEIIRNKSGDIQAFTHLPSYQMRLGRMEEEHILVNKKILKMEYDGSVSIAVQPMYHRFRKYAQCRTIQFNGVGVSSGGKIRWFKEFGDHRIYNIETGDIDPTEQLPENKRANEVVHMKIYSTRTPYGIPRYIGNLLSVFGDRAAEEINFTTFKNNNIPSMAICVSNGQLTDGTVSRIQEFIENQVQGSSNYSKVLIIEAETGDEEGEESGAHTKLEIKPLTENQHDDAMFQKYSAANQDRIRRVWRLPPIYVGRADDYTRATAESSRVLADEQVFAPERNVFDDFINRVLFPEMGIVYHSFKSNSPNTTDNQQLVRILSGSEKTGGMTPRIARQLLEEIMGRELPAFPADFPLDVPFSLTMAEAVKNTADPAEPGQQITALKAADMILLEVQKRIEGAFQEEIVKHECYVGEQEH
jgi:PBSX family phage portal protein